MLETEQIARIAHEVAAANLGSTIVDHVTSEPTTDSEGEDALRITIVIAPGSPNLLNGDQVLDTLVQIHDRLWGAGEERFSIIGYATTDELLERGDPES